jgi:hypothetical protein
MTGDYSDEDKIFRNENSLHNKLRINHRSAGMGLFNVSD